MMENLKNYLPDKIFGKDVGLLLVWTPLFGITTVLLLLFINVIVPKISDISSLYEQIDKVKKEIVLLNAKRIYLLSLDQADLQSKSSLVESGVLSEKNSYLLIKIISKIAANFEYSVGDFSVTLGDVKDIDKKSATFDYQKVPVEVELTGPKSRYLELVSEIENSLPILSIDDFNMSINNDIAIIKMKVSAYYLAQWTQNKLEGLSVTDLTPSKNEVDVLSRIGVFKFYGTNQGEIGGNQVQFIPSNRVDPFY